MRAITLLTPLPLLILVACKAPPEAPQDLHELAAYLYEHCWDDDPESLQVGLEQLTTWLDANPDVAFEGYAVAPLSEAAVDALDAKDRTTTDMVGLSLTRMSHHPIEDSAWALVSVDHAEIYPDAIEEFDREYLSGPECFVERSCDRMETIETLHNTFLLGLESWGTAHNQFVWADLEGGTAMVNRNWEIAPPETNSDLLNVDERAYLSVYVPGTTFTWRLQALWTVYSDDNDAPENLTSSLVLDFFADGHDDLETWLDENPTG